MPEKNDEILVSYEYYKEHVDELQELEHSQFSFKDIHADYYNKYFSSNINLFTYFPEGVKIVGVIQSDIGEVDIYLKQDIFNEICNDYYNDYYCKKVLFAKGDKYRELVKKMDENHILVNEPAANRIYEFDGVICKMRLVLYILLSFATILNVVMLVTFINISITENMKNIGILRALGVTMKDTCMIFEVEFWLIHILSLILGVVLINVVVYFSNLTFMKNMIENPFHIVDFSVSVFIGMTVLELFINKLSLIIPIKKLSELKPVEIINRS